MNEAKPIVTCHGNQSLFSSLHPAVVNGLPKEPCEWRRSYGRAPRLVHLCASFVPYDADILPEEEEKTLVSRPYFHIFWTDCDLETYKQCGKDEITEWLAALKARNIPDWLIVVVSGEDSKVKTKLLQRASVADKVKSDFCSKYTDRCVVLSEPTKLDSKSSESWSQFFQKLRTLLLEAFNRHLNKYEDGMRTRREKRNESGWNYFSYFIVQEELAFMFEMLGLKEDALIQYDELDAMFDQFVENFASGDTVRWLAPLTEPCASWAGLSLNNPLDLDLRQEIKQNSVSLLAFRNYLFSRQAALLFQMGRVWEVAMRAMDYLYNTVVEMKALEIEVPKGAVSCWVFLSCLEVLRACEHHNGVQIDGRFALYSASLWDYARKKLRDLGQLCSLMPGLEPSSDQLSLVVDLVSGMGVADTTLIPGVQSPVDKLRESLSSPESFKKHYLDMCEQAMGTFKYIGRFRSARLIGMELSEFYLKVNEASKAENFLLDSIAMYQQEGWHHLADGTMLELARCQEILAQPEKYLKTCCHVACSQYLPVEEREKYYQEMVNTLEQIKGEEPMEMRASQSIFLEHLQLDSTDINLNDDISLNVTLHSNFPKVMTFCRVQISLVKSQDSFYDDNASSSQSSQARMNSHRRQPSGTHITPNKMNNFQPVSKTLPDSLAFHTFTERTKGRLVSCGTACARAHEILARSDSSNSNSGPTPLVKEDYSTCFCLDNVTLQPGQNILQFTAKMTDHGFFRLGQICFTVQNLDLLKPLTSEAISFKVVSTRPSCTLKPKHADEFIQGIEQEALLVFNSGSYHLDKNSHVSVTTSPFFNISFSTTTQKSRPDNKICVEDKHEVEDTCSAEEEEEEGRLNDDLFIEEDPVSSSSEKEDGRMMLSSMSADSMQEIPVTVCMAMRKEVDEDIISQVSVSVEGWQETFVIDVNFIHPFQASHKMFTSGSKKFFQLSICGVASSVCFSILQPQLKCPACRDIDLVLLNPPNQKLIVNRNQSVSLLWALEANLADLPSLDLNFSCRYSSSLEAATENDHPRLFHYSCSILDFQTQYILSYSVSSIEEDKDCSVGETAILDINIKQVVNLDLTEGVKLAYAVKADGKVWALGEKSSGLFSLKEGRYTVALDVVPMQAGSLFFPLVTLYRCLDQTEDGNLSDGEDSIESDEEEDLFPLQSQSLTKAKNESKTRQLPHKLLEFRPGQVYNTSNCRQIQVKQSHVINDGDTYMGRS